VRLREQAVAPGSEALTEAVAKSLFKLMAYKDEYEVARLYTDGSFRAALHDAFEGEDMRLTFHMAPPLLAKVDPASGRPKKMSFGPWMLRALRVLARFRGLRGTALDPFGRSEERRDERARIEAYRVLIGEQLETLEVGRLPLLVELAGLPLTIRGYGPVRAKNAQEADHKAKTLLAALAAPVTRIAAE
jgi:indolepyruvate ferredoxin oxidoreductase